MATSRSHERLRRRPLLLAVGLMTSCLTPRPGPDPALETLAPLMLPEIWNHMSRLSGLGGKETALCIAEVRSAYPFQRRAPSDRMLAVLPEVGPPLVPATLCTFEGTRVFYGEPAGEAYFVGLGPVSPVRADSVEVLAQYRVHGRNGAGYRCVFRAGERAWQLLACDVVAAS